MRLFCQPSWIGAWRTQQKRSYFALRLSKRWWLWGTDIQFDTYMDGPQLDYFRAASHLLEKGDRVIIVTAKPSWVKADDEGVTPIKKQGSWQTLSFVEERLVRSRGAHVAVTLSGDAHHYVRYRRCDGDGPQERITSGGGGAHTSATHALPGALTLTPETGKGEQTYTRKTRFPPAEESEKMRTRGAWSVFARPSLGALIGGIYGVFALLVAGALKDQASTLSGSPLGGRSWTDLLWDGLSWWNVGLAVLLGVGLVLFADAHKKGWMGARVKGVLFGVTHWAAHVVPAVGVSLLLLWLLRDWGLAEESGLWMGAVVALAMIAVGYLYGSFVLSCYFWLTNRNDGRQHSTEIFGGLASTQYKNFLRLRIDADEKLTIFPIGIRDCPEWRFPREGEATDSWFVPVGDPPRPELIEPPIVIDPDG